MSPQPGDSDVLQDEAAALPHVERAEEEVGGGLPAGRTQVGCCSIPRTRTTHFRFAGSLGRTGTVHPIWYTSPVLDYFKRHGLPILENIEFDGREDRAKSE